jgi:hypothetical protein
MTANHAFYEKGIRVWLCEMTLLSIFYEIWDPATDEAYETAEIILDYTTDPKEEVVIPPVDELEAMLKKLSDLPPGAKFRLVARRAPGYTHVDGWVPTQLKPLKNGVGKRMTIGDQKFGYGPISGELVYTVSNWGQEQEETQGISHQ